MSDDRAPRWLVRWLWTAILLAMIAGAGYWLWWGMTAPDRAEHQADCARGETYGYQVKGCP